MAIFVSKFGHRSLVLSPAGFYQGVLTCKSLIRELVNLCRLPSELLLRLPGIAPPSPYSLLFVQSPPQLSSLVFIIEFEYGLILQLLFVFCFC